MDSFWSKLLILGIVAAIGLFFIGNVYAPQKSAQEAMADSTQQSVNAVKMGIEDTAALMYSGEDVSNTVKNYCIPGNTTDIVVVKSDRTYTFRTDKKAVGTGEDIDAVVDSDEIYSRRYSTGEIRFTEQ